MPATWAHLTQFGADDDETWREDAACYATGMPETWFPSGGRSHETLEQLKMAKRICRNCPVKTECLIWALKRPGTYGIWGGTTPREREAIRRRYDLNVMGKRAMTR